MTFTIYCVRRSRSASLSQCLGHGRFCEYFESEKIQPESVTVMDDILPCKNTRLENTRLEKVKSGLMFQHSRAGTGVTILSFFPPMQQEKVSRSRSRSLLQSHGHGHGLFYSLTVTVTVTVAVTRSHCHGGVFRRLPSAHE